MIRDPIVDEVRKAREEYFSKFDYDIEAFGKELMERQKEGKSPLISLRDRKQKSDSDIRAATETPKPKD